MNDMVTGLPFTILLIGIALGGCVIIKAILGRSVAPALIGFILLGFLLRIVDDRWQIFSDQSASIFSFLAKTGVIALLFRIGLESRLRELFRQLRRASFIWLGGLLLSGLLGYLAARVGLGLGLVPSLFVGVAMTATSVGVPVGVWREAGALRSEKGSLLIDVAELDDISGVILMVLLFALVPVLRDGVDNGVVTLLAGEAVRVTLQFMAFVGLCYLFSRFVEERLTHFMKRWVSSVNVLLISLGVGFVIAAAAGLAGFSVAIGAFFAGLAFSRDPDKVKMDASFEALYEMFSPFFFVGIGLAVAPASLAAAAGLGTLLLLVAAAGKFFGHGFSAWITSGLTGGLLIGVSMIPRAEITMIIMEHGLDLGTWAVPHSVFTAMVFVVLATCLAPPLGIRLLLRRWPQKENES